MKTLKHIMFTACLVALTVLVACAPASETAPVPDSQEETTQDTGAGAVETAAGELPETEISQAEITATGAKATEPPVAEPEPPQSEVSQTEAKATKPPVAELELPQPEEKQPNTEEPDQKGQTLTPFGGHRPEEIFLTLSGAEQHCISENFTMEEREQMLELASTDPRNLENASRMMRCAGEKTLLRVLITSIVTGPQPLTEQTSHCVWKGFSKIDMEGMIKAMEAQMRHLRLEDLPSSRISIIRRPEASNDLVAHVRSALAEAKKAADEAAAEHSGSSLSPLPWKSGSRNVTEKHK